MKIRLLSAVLALALASVPGMSEGQATAEIERFVRADLETRSATIEQMRARLARLQQGIGVKDEMTLISQSERAVAQAYARNGFSASSHGVFALRHATAIRAYIDGSPVVQSDYGSLTAEFNSLAGALGAARQSKGR